ncbi:MAG: OmpH family outer membrane protein [Pseudomonadota bacterium]
MRQIICVILVAAFAAIGVSASAQEDDQRLVIPSPIMVVDFDRVYSETRYGQRIEAELAEESAKVQAENDRLSAELIAEESALTEARITMEPEAFREAAEAFNERAQTVRASRETEQDRLVALLESERAQFIERIQPLINELMLQRGAVVAMNRRSVISAIGSANATEDVITFINDRLGDGRVQQSDPPTLRPEPEGATRDDTQSAPDLSGSD